MADITITAANVKKVDGNTVTDRGIAGGTITAGMPLYKDANDSNKLKPADSNASQASAQVVGVALHAALLDQPIEYAIGGDVTYGSGLTAATVYIASATAGAIAPVADLTTGWYLAVIGAATSTTNMRLRINVTNVAAA